MDAISTAAVRDVERRESPRMSVNKLAEYLTAPAGRRRRIIREQKYPQPYIVARYREVDRAMIDYLCGDANAIEKCRARFADARPEKEAEAQRIHSCIEALDAFEESLDVLDDALPLDGLTIASGRPAPDHLVFGGVSVSVRPQVVLARGDRGLTRVGCLKLYLVKTAPLDDAAGQYVSTLLAEFADRNLGQAGQVDRRMIATLDVFGRGVYLTPKSRSRRLGDITAACEEIASGWDSI